MMKFLKAGLMGAVVTVFAMAASSTPAAANNDYCREYTRTVYIGGRTQDAYGTACLQPNGDWMIVGEGLGNDIPNNVNDVRYIIHDNRRQVVPTRVVYYSEPQYRVYRSRPSNPVFVWNQDGFYRGGHYVSYKKHQNHKRDYGWNEGRGGRDRDWDRHDNRGRGRDRN